MNSGQGSGGTCILGRVTALPWDTVSLIKTSEWVTRMPCFTPPALHPLLLTWSQGHLAYIASLSPSTPTEDSTS